MGDRSHSEQHLREAREVVTFGNDPGQLEIQLGHVCNNRCVFCVSGQLTEQGLAKQIPNDPVFQVLRSGAAKGMKRVTFLGGEPTVQKSFLPSVKLAVELGFEEIVIFTNGVKTRKKSFIDKLKAIGGNYEWRFSVQGATRASHDEVTERPGSFDRIVAGMRYVADLGEDVTINMCINEYSYRSVPHFPKLCQEYDVRQLHIDQVRPRDAGVRTDEYLRDMMTQYKEMAPYLAEMLEGFEAIDPEYDVNLGNFPYCVLPEWSHKIHHDGMKTLTVPADGCSNLSEGFDKYADKRSDKRYTPRCSKCAFQPQCNGIFDKYRELFGDDEFQPVTVEQLRVIDTDQRQFVLLVEPLLAPLLQAAPPAPWKPHEVFRDSRQRVVELRFTDDEARRAVVLVVPAGTGQSPVFATTEYDIGLRVDGGVATQQIAELVSWAQAKLATCDGVEVTQPLDISKLMLGLITPERLAKGRSRLRRLARAIERQGSFGQWHHTTTRPLTDGLGTVLTVSGPDEALLDLELRIQPEPDRPLVGVSYRLSEATGLDAARPVVQEIFRTLRG